MRRIIFTTIFFSFLAVQLCWAQNICPINIKSVKPKEVNSLATFRRAPILKDGRVKPLDTYARNILLQFSGRRNFNDEPAIKWLARLVFAPQHTMEDKIFLINNPDIAVALGIDPEKKRRYSYTQIEPQLSQLQAMAMAADQIEPKERDVVESEILRLFHNVKQYSEISLSFAFAFPHPDFNIASPELKKILELDPDKNQFSFIDIALKADILQQLTAPLERLPEEKWNEEQQQTVMLVNNLFQWSMVYRDLTFHILPSFHPDDKQWYSPWDAIAMGLHTKEGSEEIANLRNMVLAYWKGDQINFDINTKLFTSSISKRAATHMPGALDHLSIELLYNKLQLLPRAKLIYLIVFLLFCISFLIKRKFVYIGAWSLGILAFAAHTIALVMRIVILERPPVSNLYETFIFVGFVSVLTGLIIERINKQWIGLLIISLSGSVFLTIASKFSAEGDTLQMLVAVLNSNFWLGTHVLSITIGYAGACVAGIVGHIYILQSIFKTDDKELLKGTQRILIGTLGFGLAMTFLGTNLGGIWADQSWGRFWGWDPKENGALLIILWIALLFHAKVGKMIGPLGLAAGSAFTIVVVMWAWFGVNLLSIGLHSYGFTSGLGRNLAIYYAVQVLFLVIATPIAKRRLKNTK